jgi:hypothetical protein
MGSDLKSAMILADRLEPIEFARRCCFKIAFDLGMERRLVILYGRR